jgi:hypothetical protein
VVEPAGGLPKVDREFYGMQGELYIAEPFGAKRLQEFSVDKLVGEHSEYLNGAVGALNDTHFERVQLAGSPPTDEALIAQLKQLGSPAAR